jgi:hypothetical protein
VISNKPERTKMKFVASLNKIGSRVYRVWMAFAKVLAFVNTRFILTLVYFIILGPLALFTRMFGKDPLSSRPSASGSYWRKREAVENTVESSQRQF